MAEPWKPCSVCKKVIPLGGKYYKCSVSTCNSARIPLLFCSMACWDAHVPTMNHRSGVWATEERAPNQVVTAESTAPTRPAAPPEPERRLARPAGAPSEPEAVLIIASRLKEFIKDEADFNTSAEVMDALSDMVREATRDAIRQARAAGRRTVMARDFGR